MITGNSDKIVRNASLFGATASTAGLDLEKEHRKILLYAVSLPKDPEMSIARETYQSPSGDFLITAFLAIARTEN